MILCIELSIVLSFIVLGTFDLIESGRIARRSDDWLSLSAGVRCGYVDKFDFKEFFDSSIE